MIDEKLIILVVDDDTGDRKQVMRALQHSGLSYQAVEVSDMKEALAACKTQVFDCAIVDYHMPGQDGLSGISAFQTKFPYMGTIMVTGQGDEVVASEVIKRGAGDYIPKDLVNAPTLKRVIEHVLEKTAFQQKLDQQREELQNFSCVLVHDLKSPTRNIRTMIGIIQEKMSDQALDDEVVKYMSYVCTSVDTLDALVDALAMYTRFDVDVVFEEVSLDESVAYAASLLKSDIKGKAAHVIFQDLPCIHGHEPQIFQLFQNLLGNAVKYNESDTPTITITSEHDNGLCRIMVQDNGIGIPEKHYVKIFEPFKRLHGKDSQYAGSGLGLATCKKIVERHEGTISCESVKGQGTTFILTFPSADSHVASMSH